MATEIVNNGGSLKITTDGTPRFILKSQIHDVNVLRDTIIQIDIGQGALKNVFVDQLNVTVPASNSVDELRDQILAMLQGGGSTGGGGSISGFATEQKQVEEIEKISTISDTVKELRNKMVSIDSKLFIQPSLIDENNPNYIYRGYAMPGSKTSEAVWAIEKVSSKKGLLVHQWAGGNKNFDKVWEDRARLTFS